MPKEIQISPLTGVLDLRSSPDEMPSNGVRWRQNLQTTGEGKLRRGTGFTKLLSGPAYNNADFHDQLLAISEAGSVREPATLLIEAESTQKNRTLFVASQSRISRLNGFSGNYKLLGSGFGGTSKQSGNAPRFKSAQVGDYLAFTNDIDAPKFHILETLGGADGHLYEFDDLSVIGLRRAKTCWAWHNCLFFANVEMDGDRYGYRVVWSNYNDPTSFDPAKPESITGYQDLYLHEEILAGVASATAFLIYTTHGIWEMTVTGGEGTFSFRRIYNAEENNQKGTLAFPNCIINTGDAHLYLANDGDGEIGMYVFSQYYSKPDRPEWLHRSSAAFHKIDKTLCNAHCMGVSGDEILISVAEVGAVNDCPNITMRINKAFKGVDIMDKGFTAFCNFTPQNSMTFRDFLTRNRILDLYDLYSAASVFHGEGISVGAFDTDAPFAPAHMFTDKTTQVFNGVESILIEDLYQPNESSDSLCSILAGETMDEICRGCKTETLLVACLSDDWCLKQLGGVFYREICANPQAVGYMTSLGYNTATASYTLEGIASLIRFAPLFVKNAGLCASMLEIDCIAEFQQQPSQIGLRVGISGQIADPNTDECRIVWHQHSLKDLECISKKTADEHRADNTMPSETLKWGFYRRGKILYFELRIDGVGGDAVFSRVSIDAERYTINNY